MANKKKNSSVERRKSQRRKPGDQRFSGRLIDVRPGTTRKGDRRKLHDRRKG